MSRNSLAVFSHENFFDCSIPLLMSSFLSSLSKTIFSMALRNDCLSEGSKYMAASSQTSGIDDVFDVNTGQSQAIASISGNPNPSYKLGKMRHCALLYNAGIR